jgi:hypothetical protein
VDAELNVGVEAEDAVQDGRLFAERGFEVQGEGDPIPDPLN